tara:strand:+ start:547 stop:1026 length:480 start_codon:yes stop_codon:yes gene_type:complete
MSAKVIKNFLPLDLIKFLEKSFLYDVPHSFGHVSDPNSENNINFYNSNLNMNDTMLRYIVEKLREHFTFKDVLRSYINVQHYKMDGNWHTDDGALTILLMITKTLKKGEGCFQIKENDNITNYDFEQNTLIGFNAKSLHRGLAPDNLHNPRITLAFKTL